jgi:hypothetical protein
MLALPAERAVKRILGIPCTGTGLAHIFCSPWLCVGSRRLFISLPLRIEQAGPIANYSFYSRLGLF